MPPPRILRAPRPAPVTAELDDGDLFRASIGRVRALSKAAEDAPSAPKPAARAVQFERDEAAVRDELLDNAFDPGTIEVGDEIHYLKDGQPSRVLKRLRRGHYSIRAEIDLHQMSASVARTAISEFIDDAIRNGELCVRIVHGKGLRSSSRGPVLKRLVDQMLRKRGDVIAFSSALPAQGGTGALLVLLAAR